MNQFDWKTIFDTFHRQVEERMRPVMRKSDSGFPTRSDLRPGLKFWIYEVEGLYYLCSESVPVFLHIKFLISRLFLSDENSES